MASLFALTGLASCVSAQPAAGPGARSATDPGVGFDILLRNGRVLDGSGNAWVLADVGIRANRIAAVGDLRAASADTVIDVRGMYVAPGFIDTHSHAGGALAGRELSGARALLAQGITTVFVNPDGGGNTDLVAQRTALLEHGPGKVGSTSPEHGRLGARAGNCCWTRAILWRTWDCGKQRLQIPA